MVKKHVVECIKPGSFFVEKHFYSKVLNAQLHPLVAYFLTMSKDRIVKRYCHLNPRVKADKLKKLLSYQPHVFRWGGSDLFHVTTDRGERSMVLVETNSSPSGQKSMPLFMENKELGGYQFLLEKSFIPLLKDKKLPKGSLAVFYDKNYMEASGYAAALAELTKEKVYLVPFFNTNEQNSVKLVKGVFHVLFKEKWNPIKAALRYVTQKPWNRIPLKTKTLLYNPTIVCLSGGRNKMMAAKAYELMNAKLTGSGLKILTPQTIRDVSKNEIPLWVQRFNGHAVVKIPYSNAGQGVFTITSEEELKSFMKADYQYNQFIVQSLIGNSDWSTEYQNNKYYHIGTVPNKKNEFYAADLRMMLIATKDGLLPTVLYARRAEKPLPSKLSKKINSWSVLGTNLSIKEGQDQWSSDTNRLLIMDRREFNRLGMGIDDLIEAYVQTVLAMIAIDKMAQRLLTDKGDFKTKLFASLNADKALLDEINHLKQ